MEARTTTATPKRNSGKRKPAQSPPKESVEAFSVKAEESKFDDAKSSRSPKKSLDATQLYLNEIGYSPLLSADEEKYFARLALKGDEASRRRMIESNLRLERQQETKANHPGDNNKDQCVN